MAGGFGRNHAGGARNSFRRRVELPCGRWIFDSSPCSSRRSPFSDSVFGGVAFHNTWIPTSVRALRRNKFRAPIESFWFSSLCLGPGLLISFAHSRGKRVEGRRARERNRLGQGARVLVFPSAQAASSTRSEEQTLAAPADGPLHSRSHRTEAPLAVAGI